MVAIVWKLMWLWWKWIDMTCAIRVAYKEILYGQRKAE